MRSGDTIGHYEIDRLIGQGGMGEVWLAHDARLDRKVAIKIIARAGSSEETRESAARLLREARAAASLTHPNVVSVFDVGEHEGRVYLAMEHVVGRPLRDYVGKDAPEWTRRARWLLDVARALAAAHKKGFVHRDVKPENIMVRDEDGLVKVLDFGIARRTAGDPVDPTGRTEQATFATGKGLISGTPTYMAPEQIKGGAPDARSDQFAWGIVAFELLAGRRPWPDRPDLLATVATLLTEPPAGLTDLAPDVPAPVREVVERAFARDPADRHKSMDEIVEALEAHIAGSGSAPRPSAPRVSGDTKKSVAVPSGVEVRRAHGRAAAAGDGQDGERKVTRANMVTERSLGAEPPPPRPARTKKRLVAIALALGAVGSTYAYWRGTAHPRPVKPASSAAADAGAPPKLATDNPEAARLHAEGVQLWRDGAWMKARKALAEAAAKDPGFPSPSLLLALLEATSDHLSAAAEPYQRALVQRARLGPRERALLDAMDPVLQGVEPAFGEAEKRAKAHADEDPTDAQALYWLGWVRAQADEHEAAQKTFERAVRQDPAFVPARRWAARALLETGKLEQARAALDECVRTSPAAAICVRDRLWLADRSGACAEMERDARAWGRIEGDASEPDYQLAVALAAENASEESVASALLRQWAKMTPDERRTQEPEDKADLAALVGDFTSADKLARAWANALGPDADLALHARPELYRAHLAFEEGDAAAAADIADAFEKRMRGYPQGAAGPDPSLAFDELLFRGGRITRAALEERRKEWLSRAEAKETPREKQRRAILHWADVYASFAETPEEAKEALDKQADYLPLPSDSRASLEFAAALGKTWALAGKADDALPPLERVTRSCSALKNPSLQTRAFYYLGLARETKGDLAGARDAYKTVVERWGAAKPRSTTAEKAKVRLAGLGP